MTSSWAAWSDARLASLEATAANAACNAATWASKAAIRCCWGGSMQPAIPRSATARAMVAADLPGNEGRESMQGKPPPGLWHFLNLVPLSKVGPFVQTVLALASIAWGGLRLAIGTHLRPSLGPT